VQISAMLQDGQLVIEVRDDGRGLNAPPRLGARKGAGMALANIRQRLQVHYGSSATLEVSASHPGTLARLTLPAETQSTEQQPAP
jgi:LytS/YehU family sensor histidine kinase